MYSGFTTIKGVASSATTSGPWYVGDFDVVTISLQSSTTNPSRHTIQASNADGFTAAIPAASWSMWTAILLEGNYALSGPGAVPGGSPRWMRVFSEFQGSLTSNVTVTVAGLTHR